MILGMEWLENFSPMWVDWKRKKLRFTHQGKRVTLTRVKDRVEPSKLLLAKQLKGMVKTGAVSHLVQLCTMEEGVAGSEEIPEQVKEVLSEFATRFQDPHELPPHREFDHSIPLVPNAKPVNKKPYRYSPQQKDEIERQVVEMLK